MVLTVQYQSDGFWHVVTAPLLPHDDKQLWYVHEISAENGWGFIYNAATGYVMDILEKSTDRGVDVITSPKDSTIPSSQQWKYQNSYILNMRNGMVLEVKNTDGDEASSITIANRNGTTTEKWSFQRKGI